MDQIIFQNFLPIGTLKYIEGFISFFIQKSSLKINY
jgi:hypothetical protein